jgi:hypothetical protein
MTFPFGLNLGLFPSQLPCQTDQHRNFTGPTAAWLRIEDLIAMRTLVDGLKYFGKLEAWAFSLVE